MAISGTPCVTFQQQQDNNSASCSVNHQLVALSSVSHVLRGPLTDCQSWYYQRDQAADPARSRHAATEQRKSLSGKQLMSLTLTKVSRMNPNPSLPSFPSVCHRVPPPTTPPSPQPTSWLRSPAVWPPLMTQSSCQRRASRQAERGRPFDEDPDTLQHRRHAGGLWMCSHTRTGAGTRALRADRAEKSKEKCFFSECSSLSDGFNEGIWIFSFCTRDVSRRGAAKTDRNWGGGHKKISHTVKESWELCCICHATFINKRKAGGMRQKKELEPFVFCFISLRPTKNKQKNRVRTVRDVSWWE